MAQSAPSCAPLAISPGSTSETPVNPARSTAPALFAGGDYIGQLWLFWLAPVAGAMIAGLIARILYEPSGIIDTVVVEERGI